MTPLDTTTPACTPFQRLRQLLRRFSWLLLFVPGLALYPLLQRAIVRAALDGGNTADVAQQAAAEAAKMVDWVQVYSKFSLAVGVFCLLHLLAWGALNLATPVLPDWATGRYKTPQADYPVAPGFKGTFLRLSDAQRLAFYFIGFGLELLAAWGSIDAAFKIQ